MLPGLQEMSAEVAGNFTVTFGNYQWLVLNTFCVPAMFNTFDFYMTLNHMSEHENTQLELEQGTVFMIMSADCSQQSTNTGTVVNRNRGGSPGPILEERWAWTASALPIEYSGSAQNQRAVPGRNWSRAGSKESPSCGEFSKLSNLPVRGPRRISECTRAKDFTISGALVEILPGAGRSTRDMK